MRDDVKRRTGEFQAGHVAAEFYDRFAPANLVFDFFQPSPFPERDHDDSGGLVALNDNWPIGFRDVLDPDAHAITQVRNADRREEILCSLRWLLFQAI